MRKPAARPAGRPRRGATPPSPAAADPAPGLSPASPVADSAPGSSPAPASSARSAVSPTVRLAAAVVATIVVGGLLDLFCLLLLPVRLGGHLVPLGPVLVLVVNAGVAAVAVRVAADRIPAQVLLGVTIMVSASAAVRGPGGDLLVTQDLEGMYLVFVLLACIGAAIPLFRRRVA